MQEVLESEHPSRRLAQHQHHQKSIAESTLLALMSSCQVLPCLSGRVLLTFIASHFHPDDLTLVHSLLAVSVAMHARGWVRPGADAAQAFWETWFLPWKTDGLGGYCKEQSRSLIVISSFTLQRLVLCSCGCLFQELLPPSEMGHGPHSGRFSLEGLPGSGWHSWGLPVTDLLFLGCRCWWQRVCFDASWTHATFVRPPSTEAARHLGNCKSKSTTMSSVCM